MRTQLLCQLVLVAISLFVLVYCDSIDVEPRSKTTINQTDLSQKAPSNPVQHKDKTDTSLRRENSNTVSSLIRHMDKQFKRLKKFQQSVAEIFADDEYFSRQMKNFERLRDRYDREWQETPEHIDITIKLPKFVDKKDVSARLKDHQLFISGKGERHGPVEKKEKQEHKDRFQDVQQNKIDKFIEFSRTVLLPKNIDETRIDAKILNGELRIRVPKVAIDNGEKEKIIKIE